MNTQYVYQCINSANSANLCGRFADAVNWCNIALRLMPELPEAWYNLGIAYGGLGKREDAFRSLEHARNGTLASANAQNSIGLRFLELGAHVQAEQCLNHAITLAPNFSYAHGNLGRLRAQQGRISEAEQAFRTAIKTEPNLAPAHINLAGILNVQDRYEEAVESCKQAIELDANMAEAWVNRGNALRGLKRLDEALTNYDKAITLKPDYGDAFYNHGNVLKDLNRLDEALTSYEKALSLEPDMEFVFGIQLHIKMKLCNWEGLANDIDRLVADIGLEKPVAEPFVLLSLVDSPDLHQKASRIFADKRCLKPDALKSLVCRQSSGKIRVGYYSADFRNHPVGLVMAELFELHDRSKFELYGFSFGPNTNDETRLRIAASFDHFYDVQGTSNYEIAMLSRKMGIDIAVDLGGYTADSRTGIFAARAAPVQVNYLGYPGTMSGDYIDYVIADKVIIPPESQSYFSEKIAYLPNCFFVNDSQRRISDREFTRKELGLPEEGVVFCCFNNSYKILPSTFDGWMRILDAVEGSVLWLAEPHATAATNLRKAAERGGVDSKRLVFANRLPAQEDHLARLRCADLFLDTLPYNAHMTSSDALWVGLPVLTCMGKSFAGRVAASMLTAIDLPELITITQDDYEAKAIELATHLDQLREVRDKLISKRLTTPLFNTKLFAQHIEAAYEAMYARSYAELPPEMLEITQF